MVGALLDVLTYCDNFVVVLEEAILLLAVDAAAMFVCSMLLKTLFVGPVVLARLASLRYVRCNTRTIEGSGKRTRVRSRGRRKVLWRNRVKEEVKVFSDKGFSELRLSLPVHFPCEVGKHSTSCFIHVLGLLSPRRRRSTPLLGTGREHHEETLSMLEIENIM